MVGGEGVGGEPAGPFVAQECGWAGLGGRRAGGRAFCLLDVTRPRALADCVLHSALLAAGR